MTLYMCFWHAGCLLVWQLAIIPLLFAALLSSWRITHINVPDHRADQSCTAGAIVGISCAIVIAIFMVQRFGTGRIGTLFAPVVLIYFLCNIIIAVTNIHRYKPDIFKVRSSTNRLF